jgi:hypothetical protein
MINEIQHEISVKQNRMKFIQAVIDKTIIIHILTKQELQNWLDNNDFLKIENDYRYLTEMSIFRFTKDEIAKLTNDISVSQTQLNKLKRQSTQTLWSNDLNDLEKKYKLYLEDRLFKK